MTAEAADREARSLLTHVVEPATVGVGRLVAQYGAPDAVARLAAAAPSGRARDLGRPEAQAAAAESLRQFEAEGGRFVVPGDPGWPSQLDDLGDESPFGLWVAGRGDLRLLALRSIAVVGARASTDYGARVASLLSTDFAERDWTVVSGGAYGIDASAHRGALAGRGSTVVVLACGVDVAYPTAHEALFARCADSGLLVSEAPPGELAQRWRFLDRNRLIAALTRGTVVVEAARRSGALSTARHAADMGRTVMGVPGPVTSQASVGVHELIRGGATLITSADQVITEVAGDPRWVDEPLPGLAQAAALPEPLGSVLALLAPKAPLTVEQVALRRELTMPEALALLAGLELRGLAARSLRGWVSVLD